jgi:RNA polymerase sigma-70 factor (ECF subfamily)
VSNPDDVDDLLQEILIKTHKSLQTVKDSKKIKSWIFQTAHNTIIDFYRQSSKWNTLTADDLWFEKEEPKITTELSLCVLPFIKALPQEDAELLMAIEIEGMSQKDYAKSKKINYSTLKSRVKKSRHKLYHLYRNCCDFSLDNQGNLRQFKQKDIGCTRC